MGSVTEGVGRNSSDRHDVPSILVQGLFSEGTKMPIEIIGEVGAPGTSREWIDAERQLAIKYLEKVCATFPTTL